MALRAEFPAQAEPKKITIIHHGQLLANAAIAPSRVAV
jgi:hypothetical protein